MGWLKNNVMGPSRGTSTLWDGSLSTSSGERGRGVGVGGIVVAGIDVEDGKVGVDFPIKGSAHARLKMIRIIGRIKLIFLRQCMTT
jgi:hypothetical protein